MLRYLYAMACLATWISITFSLALAGLILPNTAAWLLIGCTIFLALTLPSGVSFTKACWGLLKAAASLFFLVLCQERGHKRAMAADFAGLLQLAVVLTGLYIMVLGLRGRGCS